MSPAVRDREHLPNHNLITVVPLSRRIKCRFSTRRRPIRRGLSRREGPWDPRSPMLLLTFAAFSFGQPSKPLSPRLQHLKEVCPHPESLPASSRGPIRVDRSIM